jgi:hypothetical protein
MFAIIVYRVVDGTVVCVMCLCIPTGSHIVYRCDRGVINVPEFLELFQ